MQLNEGLEILGTDDHPDGHYWCGVFCDSALEDIQLPATLKKIEYHTFAYCENLKKIQLPENLECIEESAFMKSGLQSIILPRSVKTISQQVFFDCKSLKVVVLN